jgi:hypothetical protein
MITGLYAGMLGIALFLLDAKVGSMRGKLGISVYDGGNKDLGLAIRQHGNFTEHVPMVLILLAMVEMNGVPGWAMHAMGAGLVVARVVHFIGLDADQMGTKGRTIGAVGSGLVSIVAAVWLIYIFIST